MKKKDIYQNYKSLRIRNFMNRNMFSLDVFFTLEHFYTVAILCFRARVSEATNIYEYKTQILAFQFNAYEQMWGNNTERFAHVGTVRCK